MYVSSSASCVRQHRLRGSGRDIVTHFPMRPAGSRRKHVDQKLKMVRVRQIPRVIVESDCRALGIGPDPEPTKNTIPDGLRPSGIVF